MPGPCNGKKRKQQAKAKARQKVQAKVQEEETNLKPEKGSPLQETTNSIHPSEDALQQESIHRTPSPIPALYLAPETIATQESEWSQLHNEDNHSALDAIPAALQQPFIHDPGNGPRVRNAAAYLSSFFAPRPTYSDPMCAAFAAPSVLHALRTILPEEVALIVWYNKTRQADRICPGCQRLYKLGDELSDLMSAGSLVEEGMHPTPPLVQREQQISGLCSSACFLLACYSSNPYIAEIAGGALGRSHHEIDDRVRAILDNTDKETAELLKSGRNPCQWKGDLQQQEDALSNRMDVFLGRVLRMTRCWDLGLQVYMQRFMPGE